MHSKFSERWCNSAFLLITRKHFRSTKIHLLDKRICDSRVGCRSLGRDSDRRVVYSLLLSFSPSRSLSLSLSPFLISLCRLMYARMYRAYRNICVRYIHDWSNKNRIYEASVVACEDASNRVSHVILLRNIQETLWKQWFITLSATANGITYFYKELWNFYSKMNTYFVYLLRKEKLFFFLQNVVTQIAKNEQRHFNLI